MKNSKIEWTDNTGNIWWGCDKVHKGCDNCYADATANRWGKKLWGRDADREFKKKTFANMLTWQAQAQKENKKVKVFVNSMSDIFEKNRSLSGSDDYKTLDQARGYFFNEIVPACPNLIFQLLTKRPGLISKLIPFDWKYYEYPRNVIIGTSIVDQATEKMLMPKLIEGYEGFKFLSIEPQLDMITMNDDLTYIDWVIQGGESGPKRRPFDLSWAYSMQRDCDNFGIPYFFKQIDKVIEPPADLAACKAFPTWMQ